MLRRKLSLAALLLAAFAFTACADATGPDTREACGGSVQGADLKC